MPANRGDTAMIKEKRSRLGVGDALEKLARWVTEWTGGSWAFAVALATIVVWGATGPVFGFSDTWQLVINTGTTIITFLMVFLIQRSPNKDSHALHLKLNEIVAALQGASNRLIKDTELPHGAIEGERVGERPGRRGVMLLVGPGRPFVGLRCARDDPSEQ